MELRYNWEKVFWINPKSLILLHTSAEGFSPDFNPWGFIRKGDWDLQVMNFKDFPTLESLRQVLFENKQFETTKLYDQMANNALKYKKFSLDFVKQRAVSIKNTFEEIKNKGFLLQEDLHSKGVSIYNPDGKFHDYISGAINRHGQIMLLSGYHRLAIAKLLCLDLIPLKIRCRHEIWDDFVSKTKSLSEKWWGKGKVYQPIPHFDFDKLNPIWSNRRFHVIKRNIEVKSGKVLDAGSCFGYFSHEFEGLGFEVTAVETYEPFYNILTKLRNANFRKFKIETRSFIDVPSGEFNVVLFLNILHHMVKTEQDFNRLTTYLKSLKASEIFFQSPEIEEEQLKGNFFNESPRIFADYISRNTNLKNISCIYRENNRPLFRLSN